ncbi:uncharacterized protein LOC117648131 [Thrips palmi]|uniref:Uncharacterized protein LOC117648131 n=1 Tax=Thrips palmi TaxID=161013 RepID=A0A6P8Z7Y3_THRPL|nr:uncharacterized protein LOC117648131 [Thrips palmi]
MSPLLWTSAQDKSDAHTTPAHHDDDEEDVVDDEAVLVQSPTALTASSGLATRMLQYAGQLWSSAEQGTSAAGRQMGRHAAVIPSSAPPLTSPPALAAIRKAVHLLKEKQD